VSAVLHKGSSSTARSASLELIAPDKPKPAPAPDQRDLEIARLTAERDELAQKLLSAERQRAQELDTIKAAAHRAAALEFEQDDARRVELMAAALEKSVVSFETHLIAQSRRLAPSLARQALERLVHAHQTDVDWLTRVIERKLDTLIAQSVVGLQISSADFGEEIAQRLGKRLAAGATVAADPSLGPGSARISLRLGEVLIDPANGLTQLLALLDDLDGNDD
jgi:small-conductance mechanosensitive channel